MGTVAKHWEKQQGKNSRCGSEILCKVGEGQIKLLQTLGKIFTNKKIISCLAKRFGQEIIRHWKALIFVDGFEFYIK